ncbi:hypothetical protein BG910_06215 [Neisseria chenwenguii]|uniref:Uncharacterized protein n=1 Tax=Neisseria chenwenguii TaxID=1853278 RepID=A0A220S2H4_9NEIS|nr:hypothetical protein BG910_06215 [Neisseria chenwenguii]ROV56944.1 hypothetical protein EGS38_01975 [Neisseria chenwenguii]
MALHLTAVLFAALTAYALISALYVFISGRLKTRAAARLLAVAAAACCVGLPLYFIGNWAGDRAVSGGMGAGLLKQAASVLEQLHTLLPQNAEQYLPESAEHLRAMAAEALHLHAAQIQAGGMDALRLFGHIIAGLVIGAIAAVQAPPERAVSDKPLVRAASQGFGRLYHSFIQVFGAQLKISALNTALTAVYLLGILPLIGKPLPLTGALLALTFAAGLLPVVGNLISNTFIVLLSLSHGLTLTLLSLSWLVGIHKLEYFFNAHIIGHKIKAAAWELLTVMIAMEAASGLPGLICAPVMYAQLKSIWAERAWV